MSDMQIQAVLSQIRSLQQAVRGQETPAAGGSDFASLLKKSLDEVNAAQQRSADLTTRFAAGDENVSLSEAVIAMQRASLEFEAVTQVRNRLLSAYQEIMNMQI